MLEIVGELIVGILIGVLELIGDSLLEGVFEGFVKFVAAVWSMLAGYWSGICDWIAKLIT